MPFLFSPTVRRESSAFFAAMNTPKGFVSEFSSLFSPYATYMIKGGPGTGKSTLMRKIAKEAEARGIPVRLFYCSSDPASLDAIVIDALKIALIDATAPHSTEPSLVGIKDFYLDLAQFVTPDIRQYQSEIEALTKRKKEAYDRAYLLLGALYHTDRALDSLRIRAFDADKCEKALIRLIERLGLKEEPTPQSHHTPISAIGCNGYVALDGYREAICTEIEISDRYSVGHLILEQLCRLLQRLRISYRYSLSPLTLKPDTLFIEQQGILITSLPLCEAPALRINCERFLNSRGQGLYKGHKTLVSAQKQLFTEACKAFGDAAEAHKTIETRYGSAMNFNALTSFTSALIREIFSY